MFAQSAPAKPDKTRFAIQAADASVSIGGLGGPAAAFRAARAVPWLSRALRASKPELEVVGTDTNGARLAPPLVGGGGVCRRHSAAAHLAAMPPDR